MLTIDRERHARRTRYLTCIRSDCSFCSVDQKIHCENARKEVIQERLDIALPRIYTSSTQQGGSNEEVSNRTRSEQAVIPPGCVSGTPEKQPDCDTRRL